MSTDSVTLQSGDTLTSQATIEDDGEGNVQITEQSMTVTPSGSAPPRRTRSSVREETSQRDCLIFVLGP